MKSFRLWKAILMFGAGALFGFYTYAETEAIGVSSKSTQSCQDLLRDRKYERRNALVRMKNLDGMITWVFKWQGSSKVPVHYLAVFFPGDPRAATQKFDTLEKATNRLRLYMEDVSDLDGYVDTSSRIGLSGSARDGDRTLYLDIIGKSQAVVSALQEVYTGAPVLVHAIAPNVSIDILAWLKDAGYQPSDYEELEFL